MLGPRSAHRDQAEHLAALGAQSLDPGAQQAGHRDRPRDRMPLGQRPPPVVFVQLPAVPQRREQRADEQRQPPELHQQRERSAGAGTFHQATHRHGTHLRRPLPADREWADDQRRARSILLG
jgi:hypothetical protein